jgi:uncharacterized protein
MNDAVPPNDAPLGPDDFDAQEDVLDALREADELVPGWEFCEGFIAGLICTRRNIEPEEYWPVLLGEQFNPMDHMEFVWRWKRRWAEVQAALDIEVDALDDERAYHPEVLDMRGAVLQSQAEEQPQDQEPQTDIDIDLLPAFAEPWAQGFLQVVSSWSDEWVPPRDREVAEMLADALEALEALAQPDTGKPAISYIEGGPPTISEQRLNDFGEALWAVYDLRQLWRSLGPRIDSIRKAPEPGRNDPCPCGSGKKYKKCHGA